MVEEVYCRYEGENNQRHLEEYKMNWSMRRGGEKGRENRREVETKRGTCSPEAKRAPSEKCLL